MTGISKQLLSRSDDYVNNLGPIENSRDRPGRIRKSAGYDQFSIRSSVHTGCKFGEPALSRRISPLPQEPELAAVRMPGEDEIDPSTYKERVAKTPVFGMMAKKDLISLLPFEFGEPVRARHDLIMIPKIRKLRIKHSGSVSLALRICLSQSCIYS